MLPIATTMGSSSCSWIHLVPVNGWWNELKYIQYMPWDPGSQSKTIFQSIFWWSKGSSSTSMLTNIVFGLLGYTMHLYFYIYYYMAHLIWGRVVFEGAKELSARSLSGMERYDTRDSFSCRDSSEPRDKSCRREKFGLHYMFPVDPLPPSQKVFGPSKPREQCLQSPSQKVCGSTGMIL